MCCAAGLHGVSKNFMALAFADYQTLDEKPPLAIPKKDRRAMLVAGKQLRWPTDFGRGYRDISNAWKSYHMDEWLHYLDKFSIWVFTAQLMPRELYKMWTVLRCAPVTDLTGQRRLCISAPSCSCGTCTWLWLCIVRG